ncbi:PTS IIA-like nitrogen regulatory protein PtsN [Snodgrassella alvi]|uniref:PTS IIA-like nitrogen-regulatory protein PtsN n=1 Tax=Snodgrassella alvi TaxID=1196083 RepID=A0A2N9X6W3_9NEIS|nr:PTS IIA-like nitrogen regulatory protein PtsN [Snodgrassella alvi]PIT37874.1 PTS IIA-like nitrogen-regulatory protein PtsN [Snodgrassella alvi]PIT38916.1 PTS IIA-like nitrogen-regulatory protein PtsN [Snodgrassella alvi]PIT41814.1 PTS IIA-like nitrogen-regulatory protein PtsN [Snodgrassella alvi]
MSLIGDILPVSHVVLDLNVSSKKRLFEEAGKLLSEQAGLSQEDVFNCLFAREKLGSTALGKGVAIPHGRTSTVKDTVGAFFRLQTPIAFDAPDEQPVNMVFVLLVPENASTKHLNVLSELAGKFSQKSVRNALLSATSAESVRDILVAEEL